jgi:hypothetical protein
MKCSYSFNMADKPAFVDHNVAANSSYNPSTSVPVPTDIAEDGTDTYLGRLKAKYTACKQYKDDRVKSLRPWSEFLDRSKFSAPGKLEAFSRINKNLSTFYSNYVVVTALISIYVLVSNFLFLASMIFSLAIYYWTRMKAAANEPVMIRGREFSTNQVNGFLVVFTFFMFLYTNGSSTVFWLVTLALLTVFGHAATREPADDASGSAFSTVGNQFI